MTKKVYIETYGCQMNVSDTEVVLSILKNNNYDITEEISEADLILVNTCSIRENAEQRVRGRLQLFNKHKKERQVQVGVIGCMAERLKEKLLEEEKMVDIIAGPDTYRDLPHLLEQVDSGQKAVNVILSKEETYSDISPVRTGSNNISAFISIMRGCENMCTYCIVPYTRGAERSRNPESIMREITELENQNYKEITLIGQNVDSYNWEEYNNKRNFPELLMDVAEKFPSLRIRFSTSHPKDLTDDVLQAMQKYDNICKNIHLPVQSGSTRILEKMNRGYSREWYLDRINSIKKHLPDCSISTDIMVGFCDESEEDHKDTLSLMEIAGFDFAYMFKYSERPGTKAARKMKDNIPEDTKTKRLTEIINLQNKFSLQSKEKDIGKIYNVLVEGKSKKSDKHLFGRNSQNKVIVFPDNGIKKGEYIRVKVNSCTSATLIGKED